MEVKASLNNVRIGPYKARLVADTIRGKNVNEAFRVLSFAPQKGAALIKKLLESGVANAEQKQTIDIDNLYVKSIQVNQGPSLKRFRPRAQGRAFGVLKKSSHIELVLDEK